MSKTISILPRILVGVAFSLCAIGLYPSSSAGAPGGMFQPEKATFSVRCQGEFSSLRVLGVYVLPGETLEMEAYDDGAGFDYFLNAPSGTVVNDANNAWSWRAPASPGLYPVKIERPSWACGAPADSIVLNVFVMVPYDEMNGESLRGYRIGCYPDSPPENLPTCAIPRGFVEVTEDDMSALVSPHFRLCQFLCKQEGQFPKYVVLDQRLLVKLECALEKVNEMGHRCDTFHIMSGYRTPHYNRALGNVKFSQHLWGGAADVFIDESPKDGNMDDLNGDGIVDLNDAAVIYQAIEEMCSEPSYEDLAGGLARYKRNHAHGPFVHIDVRGYKARWGS
jgi:hypothetical protein